MARNSLRQRQLALIAVIVAIVGVSTVVIAMNAPPRSTKVAATTPVRDTAPPKPAPSVAVTAPEPPPPPAPVVDTPPPPVAADPVPPPAPAPAPRRSDTASSSGSRSAPSAASPTPRRAASPAQADTALPTSVGQSGLSAPVGQPDLSAPVAQAGLPTSVGQSGMRSTPSPVDADAALPGPAGRSPTMTGEAPQAAEPALLAQAPPSNSLPMPSKDIAPQVTPPEAAAGWTSGIKFSAQIEGGIAGNPSLSGGQQNFGQLFTDHANQLQLNQVLLTAQRPTDPKATGYDFGFKLQGMYGSDARYTHFLGELDRAIGDSRNQFDIVEANVIAHLPWLTEGGIDAKLGQYSTPLGFETIDPSTNPFYSHSYIFNFGIPLKHTGVLTTTHVNDTLDVWLGIDSGVNTTLFGGDNNSRPAGIFGLGLNNLLGGKLTVLALTHIGPENATRAVPNANRFMRYENIVDVIYKHSDALSFTTELNFIKDDAFVATAYGAAQYASYALNDQLTLNGRAEVFRDNNGFFVGAFPGNLDFVNAESGRPATIIGAGPVTYGALTLGVTYKPPVPAALSTLMIRPEVRYDRALDGNRVFRQQRKVDVVTLSADAVVAF